jgi:hypothetical protein
MAILTLSAAAIGRFGDGDGLRQGDPTPGTWRGADRTAPVVAWVFRGEDCLSCFTPAYDLRRLQAEHGDRLRLWTVAVQDPGDLARPFLKRERIETVHRSLDMDAYRKAFGRTELPALYLSLRDTIRGLWRPGRGAAWDGAGSDPTLREMVAHLIARSRGRD